MSKTIRVWAELCSDNTIRKQWIENADEDSWYDWRNNTTQENMSQALFHSFRWDKSHQRWYYWDNIYRDMCVNPEKYLKKRKVMFHEVKE